MLTNEEYQKEITKIIDDPAIFSSASLIIVMCNILLDIREEVSKTNNLLSEIKHDLNG